MKVIRLTNLGNKTLSMKPQNQDFYLGPKKYSMLWDYLHEMRGFFGLFGGFGALFGYDGNELVDFSGGLSQPPTPETIYYVNEYLGGFQEKGLVELVEDNRPIKRILSDMKLDRFRNPLKYAKTVILDITGRCNLNCDHCCYGGPRKIKGLSSEEYIAALKPLLRAGITTVAFSGGEATLRRKTLLDVVKFVAMNSTAAIKILTNGTHPKMDDILKELYPMRSSVSIQTSLESLDCYEADRRRAGKGVYNSVMSLLQKCKGLGFEFVLNFRNVEPLDFKYLDFKIMYERKGISIFTGDSIQLGNAARSDVVVRKSRPRNQFGQLSKQCKTGEGWCKAPLKPFTIQIYPDGKVGSCPYMHAIPGMYGNLRKRSMEDILNNMQHSQIYHLARDGKAIEANQHEMDKEIFNRTFAASCEPFILTMAYTIVKEHLAEQGLAGKELQAAANMQVAKMYGYR